MERPLLIDLERSLTEAPDDDDQALATALVVVASVAGAGVPLAEEAKRGAARRALLLLAAGGDPARGLDLHGRAVTALAEEIRTVDRQIALERGIAGLQAAAQGLPHVSEVVHALADAPEIAWRAYACSLLAEELGEE